jgi:hypothetical protein
MQYTKKNTETIPSGDEKHNKHTVKGYREVLHKTSPSDRVRLELMFSDPRTPLSDANKSNNLAHG